YLCGSIGDGMPKSLGGVLALMNHPKEAAQVIAKYHKQDSITAQTGVATTTSTMTTISAGASVPLTVNTAGTDPKAPLIGFLLYATDDQGQKIGTFSQMGSNLAPFPACSQPGSTDVVGIVHTTPLDDGKLDGEANKETGIVWNAPSALWTKTITFGGLAVTDTGFGFHSTVFQVNGAMNPPAVGNFMPNAPMPTRVLKCFPKGQVPPGLLGQMVTGGVVGAAGNMTPINPPLPPIMAGKKF
ncbi:UNVERIFIED_CONTAM: hypothetical protein HDU68_003448, partial [Siphonaria sp. JEL0065]